MVLMGWCAADVGLSYFGQLQLFTGYVKQNVTCFKPQRCSVVYLDIRVWKISLLLIK